MQGKRDFDAMLTSKTGMAENFDRISQLPTCILHDILFHLPLADEARTCILSKSWNTFVWSSLPQRSFNFDQGWSIGKPRPNTEETQQKFIDRVEEESFQKLQSERFIIATLRIAVKAFNGDIFSSVDRWIELAAQNHVRYLCLKVSVKGTSYKFPNIALASSLPLKVLMLKKCTLEQNSLCDDNDDKPLALKELCLVRAIIDNRDGMFQNFVSRCTSLEYLRIRNSSGIKKIYLCNHPRLNELDIIVRAKGAQDSNERLDSVEVDSLSLKTLRIIGLPHKPLIVNATHCRNLQHLHVTSTKMEGQYLQNLSTHFPCLRTLCLDYCTGIENACVVRHPLLETLKLNMNRLVDLVIETPNLRSFSYQDATIPRTWFLADSSLLSDCYVHFYVRNATITATWFLQLRFFLVQFSKHDIRLWLDFQACIMDKFINVDELSVIPTHDLTEVPNITIVFVGCSNPAYNNVVDYAAFFDGLFWSCRPKDVTLSCCGKRDKKLVKVLCNIFMNAREALGCCCNSRHVKCWRHFLKLVSIDCVNIDNNDVELKRKLMKSMAWQTSFLITLIWL